MVLDYGGCADSYNARQPPASINHCLQYDLCAFYQRYSFKLCRPSFPSDGPNHIALSMWWRGRYGDGLPERPLQYIPNHDSSTTKPYSSRPYTRRITATVQRVNKCVLAVLHYLAFLSPHKYVIGKFSYAFTCQHLGLTGWVTPATHYAPLPCMTPDNNLLFVYRRVLYDSPPVPSDQQNRRTATQTV